jgi:hypothetical protein
MWWGYEHSNGCILLKKWFGDHKDYTDDCKGNEFVKIVITPFEANSVQEAMEILTKKINIKKNLRQIKL